MPPRRLLVVSPGLPHPTDGASVVLFFHYIDALRRAGFHIRNVLLLQPDNATPERLAEYETRMRGVEVTACWSRGELVRGGWRRGLQLDRAALAPAVDEARAFGADATFCLDFLCAWAMAETPGRKIVWLGDLNFQTAWYNSLYSWKEGVGPWRGLLSAAWIARLWKRRYRDVLRRFRRVIVSSLSSEAILARLGVPSRYLPYPWPSEPPASGVAKATVPTFLFFGGLQGLGSRSALHTLIDGLYPRLVRAFGPGGFRIALSGRGALPDWARAALDGKPEVEFLGFVERLPELMARCHAFVAPMDVPVGNRSRILTAMAQRLVVVAHPSTTLGNPDLVDGRTCHLAAAPEAFVERLQRVVARPDETAAIVDRAFEVYSSKFSPERAGAEMVREVQRLMEA